MRASSLLMVMVVSALAGCAGAEETALLAGLGDLEVTLDGPLPTPVLVAPVSTAGAPVVLAFDPLGLLTLNGRVLDLPRAVERRRFGVSVIDIGALPPCWRPAHAPEGGLLVGALPKASPLAIAGLRPFDRVVALDQEPVATVEEVAARLSSADRVSFDVVRADGSVARIGADAAEGGVDDADRFNTPLLFEHRSSSVGVAFGLGPLDSLFWFRRLVAHVPSATAGPLGASRYEARFAWGALGNLVRVERRTPFGGETETRVTLFGLLELGGDE